MLRRSAGFDVPDFLAAGPRDILVAQSGVDTARQVLLEAELISPDASRPAVVRPGRLLIGLLIALAIGAAVVWIVAELLSSNSRRRAQAITTWRSEAIEAISSDARSNSSSESTGVPSNGSSRVSSSHERQPLVLVAHLDGDRPRDPVGPQQDHVQRVPALPGQPLLGVIGRPHVERRQRVDRARGR